MTDDEVAAERTRLMAEGNRLVARADEHRAANQVGAEVRIWRQVREISAQYRRLLPEVAVARCPHSGEPVHWPIDTMGLDGWYWSYFKKISRTPRPPPPTWLAMTGAMRLADPVEPTPEVVVPGPGAPFVLPRLLTRPDVRAVLTEVPVGRHTGWAISYLGPRHGPLIDLWGANDYPVYRSGQRAGWATQPLRVAELDFDLTGWLRSGSLLWLEPGDESATLHEGLDGCPFVDLPGPHEIAIVLNAEIIYSDAAPA